MARLEINDTIGDYRIDGYLGEGGMGRVYRGVHQKLGRPTAIKVLSSSCEDPNFRVRFMNEARLQAGLHHPNVATLYDFREHGDELVIFMELVDGDCLDHLVDRHTFTIDEALTVFASICDAIAYIHDHGIIHRDIKAQNAKLTAAGVVKLLDFGIAKDAVSHELTQTGGIIGTPNYLSPEQLRGDPASIHSDIWALGVLLYEMVTSQLPFQADTLGALVVQITDGAFTPPDRLNPAVPSSVSRIITRCLKKDPAARFQSARSLGADVRAALSTRNANITPHDLRTAVVRAKGRSPAAPRGVTETKPSYTHTTGLTPRTRARLLVASIVGGGVFTVLAVVSIAYMFWGSSETAAQVGSKPVTIYVTRGGPATVFQGGKSVGKTPFKINVGRDEIITLTLRRQGCEDREFQIDKDDGAMSVNLECNE